MIWFVYGTPRTFSPRKRRCFQIQESTIIQDGVFSAQAEVFLKQQGDLRLSKGFLRASGGVSKIGPLENGGIEFSPRKRRCFSNRLFR